MCPDTYWPGTTGDLPAHRHWKCGYGCTPSQSPHPWPKACITPLPFSRIPPWLSRTLTQDDTPCLPSWQSGTLHTLPGNRWTKTAGIQGFSLLAKPLGRLPHSSAAHRSLSGYDFRSHPSQSEKTCHRDVLSPGRADPGCPAPSPGCEICPHIPLPWNPLPAPGRKPRLCPLLPLSSPINWGNRGEPHHTPDAPVSTAAE